MHPRQTAARNQTARNQTRNQTVFCTVVTSNYLHFALALAKSVRRQHADVPLVVCVVDRTPLLPPEADPAIQFVFGDQLGVPDWPRFSFQYSAFELACALKPCVMRYCLDKLHAARVVYLDADIQLYAPLLDELDAHRHSAIVLTPHLLAPLPDDGLLPHCLSFFRAGAYNGGFLTVRRGDVGWRFVRWWEAQLQKSCLVRLHAGLFVDQRPLDLVPGMFDDVYILRRRGFHLAYWNLYGQTVSPTDDGGYQLADGNPVTLFHFSGIDPDSTHELSRHQDRIRLPDHPTIALMLRRYVDELNACGRHTYQDAGYGYATLRDGTPICDTWRELIRQECPLFDDVRNPFDTDAHDRLVKRFVHVSRLLDPDGRSTGTLRNLTRRVETVVKWMVGRPRTAA